MGKLYERVNWEDKPSTKTPISAENLNKMDKGIGDLDDKLVEQETKTESLASQVEQIASNQIPEEYLKASVDAYIDEKGAGLATDEDLTVLDTKIDEVNNQLTSEIADIKNNVGYDIPIEWVSGQYIIYDTGAIGGAGGYNRTQKIEVNSGEKYKYNGVLVAMAGVAFYDVDSAFISGISGSEFNGVITIPTNAKYMQLSHYGEVENIKLSLIGEIEEDIKMIANDVIENNKSITDISWVIGQFVHYQTGAIGGASGYMRSGKLSVNSGERYLYDGLLQGIAGIVFYNGDTYVSGIISTNDGYFIIPNNVNYMQLSHYGTEEPTLNFVSVDKNINALNVDMEKAKEDISALETDTKTWVDCIGDSVTQGMNMHGSNFAEYGKATYPARLYTLLVDNGYKNVGVRNYGHGGERTVDIAVRCGGFPCYVAEDIIIPSDNTPVSLGTMASENGRVVGTKIKVPYSDANGNDYCVFFTMTSHDTNPIYIDGIAYTLSISGETNYIAKSVADGKETIIPKGSLLFTNNNRSPKVNVLYGGINDQTSLTLQRWLDTMKACGDVTGGKYIVLGCTHALWENWSDVNGSTNVEKYEYYKRKALETFGVHFIDLYDEFARHAVDYALSAGYFSDKTEDELATMRNLLNQHIIPKEFTYDYNSQGNVHLSEEGYHVIGMLVFERLKRLGYI